MPLELGIFLAAKYYGRREQDKKVCLIFERNMHSYEKLISDIKGQDIVAHQNDPKEIIVKIRNWLANNARKPSLRGGHAIWRDYVAFVRWLPGACRRKDLRKQDLTFGDFWNLVSVWIEDHQ
jgi:hypothetical protein